MRWINRLHLKPVRPGELLCSALFRTRHSDQALLLVEIPRTEGNAVDASHQSVLEELHPVTAQGQHVFREQRERLLANLAPLPANLGRFRNDGT